MRPHFLLACLSSLGLAAAAESPAEAAVKFCEALRDGKEQAQVIAYSALNPQTGDIKKAKIFAQWKRDAKAMLPRPFEIAEEQVRGDQAAVILSQWTPPEGQELQLSLVACIKRDGKWHACPVMGSFENSHVCYDPNILRDRQALTGWMHSREMNLREQWRVRIREQWHQRMQQSITPEALVSMTPRALLQDLLMAVRSRNQAAILARIGGFSQESLPEWSRMERRVGQIFSGNDWNLWPWKLLSSDQAIIAIGPTQSLGAESLIEVLVLHPESLSEEPDFLSFSIFRDDQGRSRVQLPETFWMHSPAEEEFGEIMDCDSPEHRALYAQIRHQARSSWNDAPIEQPDVLADVIEKSLRTSDFSSFWGAGSLPAKSGDDLLEMPVIIALWKKLHGASRGASLFGRLGFQAHKSHALLAMQSYSPGQHQPTVLHKIWLAKHGKEWFLCDSMPVNAPEELKQWWNDQKVAWSEKLADSIMEQCSRIGGLAPIAPEQDLVRQVYLAWQASRKSSDIAAQLPYCTSFQDERSVKALLHHLSQGLTQDDTNAEILAIRSHGRWTTVSTKLTKPLPHPEISYPMHVFVVTDDGPRMLAQLDLRLSPQKNASRELINQLSIRDLKKFLPDSAVGELQHLYESHLAQITNLHPPTP